MNLFNYIKQNYDSFTEREKSIADYLLSGAKRILEMSAKDIASVTNTSAPTVVRFAKKLGFSSLNEMKLQLSISQDKNKSNDSFTYLEGDLSTKNIVYGIKNSISNIMDETVSLIMEEELDKAINALYNAKNIYIFSVGVSGLVGMDFYYKLSRINKRCIAHSDTHLQLTSSVLMGEGDVAFAISYSGETREVIKCVENAKENGCIVISLTKASVNNKLEGLSDVTIKIPSVEKSLREGAISSRIAQLAVTDMLFLGMARNDIEDVEKKLIVTRNAVKEFKDQ